MSSYVFVLCPPRSGSTILWRLLSTADAVSALPTEGQFLPEVADVMRADPWNPAAPIPWDDVKRVWETYWDPGKPLLLEKSPPNLIRTKQIVEHFSPVFFVIMVRDPYAHSEGLIRRKRFDDVAQAAAFSASCLRTQAENAETLDDSVRFTYEELTADPASIAQRMRATIPQLGELDTEATFTVQSIDGMVERRIVNLNERQIKTLSPKSIRIITEVLRENSDVMAYWNYDYIDVSRRLEVADWAGRTARRAKSYGRRLARKTMRTIRS